MRFFSVIFGQLAKLPSDFRRMERTFANVDDVNGAPWLS
jgi:hypothetical protein